MREIQTVVVHSSEDVRNRLARASSVVHYDENLSKSFPYFIKGEGDPQLIGAFCDTLSDGYNENGYGPFWPSFASVNDGRDGKVLWFSEAGLGCLRVRYHNIYNFDVQEG